MEIIQAILLGVLEGFTEFLPISSTGHLIVASEFLGYKDDAKIFTVVVQLGAIAAVIWHYREDLIRRTLGLFRGNKKDVHFWKIWILATIPGALAGFLLKDKVSVYAVATTVATALILGGIVIYLVETYHKAARNRGGEASLERLAGALSALGVGRGTVVATYDKIHMFDVDLANGESYRESATFRRPRSCAIARHSSWALRWRNCSLPKR